MSDERTRFEQRFKVGFNLNRSEQGEYIDQRTYLVWLGWQEGLAMRERNVNKETT